MAPETTTTHWTPLITAGPEAPRRHHSRVGTGWHRLPRVEIEEKGTAYYVEVEVPGLTEKDLVLTIEDNTLHISGRRPGGGSGSEQDGEKAFTRSISLPAHVDPEGVKADIAHGLLLVEIPKPVRPQETHRIPIASSEPAVRSAGEPAVAAVGLEELHDPESGRLDARRMAEYLDIPLRALADALGRKYTTVHKTPASASLQPDLQRIKRSLEILEDVLSTRKAALAWWNSPHPDLDDRAPMEVLLEGYDQAILDMLEAALTGTPS